MKRLLFVVGCLLLLLAAAAPASANDIRWQVIVGPHWTGVPYICWVDFDTMTWSDFSSIDADTGKPIYYTAVPAGATDVRVGDAAVFVNRGNTQVFAKALFQRMTVEGPGLAKPVVVTEDDCHDNGYWTRPYPYNDFTNEYWGPLFAYNPRIGGGMQWEMDWMVPLLPDDGVATLTPGRYKVTYEDMLTHRCADPMFWWRVPGGDGYPPIGGPWGWWEEPGTLSFLVE